MTLQGILMNLEVPDTKEELTYKTAFAQVSGVQCGSHVHSTALVHWNDWNDWKGRRYGSKHEKFEGHHRERSGPITDFAQKLPITLQNGSK